MAALTTTLEPWNATVRNCLDAEHAVQEAVARSSARVEASARALVAQDAACRAAIHVNSPSALAALDVSTSYSRKLRQLVASYAQAFCGKCETTATAGPTNRLHHVEEPRTAGLRLHGARSGRYARTHSRLSYWAALEVLQEMWRRNPTAVLPRRSAALPDADLHPGVELEAIDLAIVRACDGTQSVAALARRFEHDSEAMLRRLTRLAQRGVVTLAAWMSPFVEDPGSELVRLLAEVPRTDAEAAHRLAEAAAAVAQANSTTGRQLALAGLEEQLATLQGAPVRRTSGGFCEDRFAYTEEGTGNIERAEISCELIDDIMARLTGALDLVASEAIEVALHERATGQDRESSRAVVRAEREARLLANLEPRLRDAAVIDLPSSTLRAWGLIRSDLDEWPLLGSADIMLASSPSALRGGELGTIVVSEVHHILPVVSIPLAGLAGISREEAARLMRQLTEVAGIERLAIPLTNRPYKVMDAIPIGAAQLNLDWTEPNHCGGASVDIGAAEIGDSERSCWMYPLYDEYIVRPAARRARTVPAIDKAPLFRTLQRTPRVLVDGVVYQRASWRLSRTDFEPEPRRMRSLGDSVLAINRARAWHGLPRYFYARMGGDEVQPMLIDSHLPELCDTFMTKWTGFGGDGVFITEMFPGADQLWLQSGDGRHCSELRITIARHRTVRTRA